MSTKTEPCPRCVERGKDSRGDNLVVWPDTSAHCFSCGLHRWPKTYTIKEKVEHVPKSLLPFDFTREVPNHAWQWLLQWGLPIQYWKESVGYSPSQERLIFRVGDTCVKDGILKRSDLPLAFSLGRHTPATKKVSEASVSGTGVGEANSDYALRRGGQLSLQRTAPIRRPVKWLSFGDCHKHAEIIGEAHKGGPIVLVEDLISGHKVAASENTSIPLFGTKIATPVLYYLMNSGRPVSFWLDKDQEGNVKKQAIHLQGLLNRPVNVIITDQDPKALSLETIRKYL